MGRRVSRGRRMMGKKKKSTLHKIVDLPFEAGARILGTPVAYGVLRNKGLSHEQSVKSIKRTLKKRGDLF